MIIVRTHFVLCLQVAVQQIDDQHTQAAVVTPGVLVTSSRSVTSAAQSIEKSRSTTPQTSEVFSLFKAPEETPAEMVLIRKYLKTEESRCWQNMRKKMRRKASNHNNASVTHQWCPCLPQNLSEHAIRALDIFHIKPGLP